MKKYTIWSDTYFWDREAMKSYEEETRAYLMEDCGNEERLQNQPRGTDWHTS